MTWSLPFRKATSAKRGDTRSVARRKPSLRLGLERLEDRTLLAAGALDPTFGDGGKVLTAFPGVNAQANQVLIQSDSKILAAGVAGSNNVVVRYQPDGSLDPTFANAGRLTLFSFVFGGVVSLQADGKLVVGGSSFERGPLGTNFQVARFLPNGTPDSSFGTTGVVETSFPAATGIPNARVTTLAPLPDGKLLAVGFANERIAMARYQANGQLDTTFGIEGTRTFSPPSGWNNGVRSFLVQPDGRIVATGILGVRTTEGFGLARFNADGSPDTGFGTNGTTVLLQRIWLEAALLQPDGRIVVAATIPRLLPSGRDDFFNIGVFRFQATGTLDPSFGLDGRVETVLDFDNNATRFGIIGFGKQLFARNVTLTRNGQIVVVGEGRSGADFVAIRYRADGSFESNFGRNGAVVTTFTTGSVGEWLAAAIQSDGKLVVAGRVLRAGSGQMSEFALARYLGFSANEQFVAQVYPDLLGREADGGGLAFWTGQLDRGLSRDQIVAAIQSSPETRTRVVRESYRRLLGRDAEQAGIDAWVSFLGRGGTAEQMETAILASDEYFRKHGGDNAGFVTALYRDVLGRGPEPGAVEAWAQVLAGGTPRGIVARVFQGSLESDRREVRELYRRYLRREADPAGLEFFAGLLQRGTANEQVILVLVASPEYAGRA